MVGFKPKKKLINLNSCSSKADEQLIIQVCCCHRKAAFFDRDGVINVDYGYVSRIEDLSFIDGVFSALDYIQSKNYDIFIVTNQAGVARGYHTEADVQALHNYMDYRFKARGIEINGYLYCPHHVNATVEKYSKDCSWRKPNPGMIEAIMSLHQYDKKKCFMIGDRDSDMVAANKAGIYGKKFIGESLLSFIKENIKI